MAKGLSFDEKKARLLELLLESKEVYRLKDLEKVAPKKKGIISQSVKDVLQMLCDEGLVDYDKIGSGNFFWALPSKAVANRANKLAKFTEKKTGLEACIEEHKNNKRKLEEERCDEERDTKLQKYNDIQAETRRVDESLAKYAASDPEIMERVAKQITTCKDAANRWTDNVFLILKDINEKRPDVSTAEVLQNFGIPTDLDNL